MSETGCNRRDFVSYLAVTAAATTACSSDFPDAVEELQDAHRIGRDRSRCAQALKLRLNAAREAADRPCLDQPNNGDIEEFPSGIANYTKGLPHDSLGVVEPQAYRSLRRALRSGRPEDFEEIILGLGRRLTSPQAGLAFDLENLDVAQYSIPPPPSFSSEQAAAEMVQLYWAALLRDVPFADYPQSQLVASAVRELNRLRYNREQDIEVTPETLFRGGLPGSDIGPHVSQFLLQPFFLGPYLVEQRLQVPVAGVDYLTKVPEWLAVQNGLELGSDFSLPCMPTQALDGQRYIRSGRDLGQYVHIDQTSQNYVDALFVYLTLFRCLDPRRQVNQGSYYARSRTQVGFVTLGVPYFQSMLGEVTTRALKALWFQKWFVHLYLRPEEFGGRVHFNQTGRTDYPIHDDLLSSKALDLVSDKYGTYLLPQEYPEGSPTHPSYGSGHAVIAGACVTLLKAFLNGSLVIPNPVQPSDDGRTLRPFRGPDLIVTNELNKLAANISIGRLFAGVHYYSDYIQALRLGERIAIYMLREQKPTLNEPVTFAFRSFDDKVVEI